MSVFNPKVALPALFSLALLGCAKEGDLTVGGIIATRSACPTVAIPAPTGDITLFNPESSRDASAIDVVASIRSEEHTSELQSLMRISYAVFCLKKKKTQKQTR